MNDNEKIINLYIKTKDDDFLINYLSQLKQKSENDLLHVMNHQKLERLDGQSLVEFLILNDKTNILKIFANHINPMVKTKTKLEYYPNFGLNEKNVKFEQECNIGFLLLSQCTKQQISRFVRPIPEERELSFRKIFKNAVLDSEADYLNKNQDGLSFAQTILQLNINNNDFVLNQSRDSDFIESFMTHIDFSKSTLKGTPMISLINGNLLDIYEDFPVIRKYLITELIEQDLIKNVYFSKNDILNSSIFQRINQNNVRQYSEALIDIIEKKSEILLDNDFYQSLTAMIKHFNLPDIFQTIIDHAPIEKVIKAKDTFPEYISEKTFAKKEFSYELFIQMNISNEKEIKAFIKNIKENKNQIVLLEHNEFKNVMNFLMQRNEDKESVELLNIYPKKELMTHFLIIKLINHKNEDLVRNFFEENVGMKKYLSQSDRLLLDGHSQVKINIPSQLEYELIENLLDKLKNNPNLYDKKLSTIFYDTNELKDYTLESFVKKEISYGYTAKDYLNKFNISFEFLEQENINKKNRLSL